MDLFDLSGQVAVITGSSKGIGRAIASRMAQAGAKTVISSRKADVCEEVAKDINANWAKGEGEATAIACHIGYKEQLQSLVDQTLEKWGRIDTLVCNAAVNPYYGPSFKITDEAFDKIMDSNVKSNFWLCNMVLPHMAERKDGSIIIVSSVGGFRGSSVLGTYALSKAADFQLARNLAVEWGKRNIRANCIAPGLVRTDFARALWDDAEREKAAAGRTPIGRIGEPDDIAGAAIFLASRAGSWMTGQVVVIDGGSTIA